MTVLVFGALGATGQHIVAQANRRGHEVLALLREKPRVAGFTAQQIVRGDATSLNDVEAAIGRGCDVVISALGARSLKKTRLLEISTKNIVEAMGRNQVSRLIELSAAGTFGLPRASRISIPARVMFHILRRTMLRNSFDDHAAADRMVHQSGLDWTIVQPPELIDEPPRGYCIALDGLSRGGAIARADVAAAIIDIMENGSFIRQSSFVFRAPKNAKRRLTFL
jgi:putative NADH-flavin reductase